MEMCSNYGGGSSRRSGSRRSSSGSSRMCSLYLDSDGHYEHYGLWRCVIGIIVVVVVEVVLYNVWIP